MIPMPSFSPPFAQTLARLAQNGRPRPPMLPGYHPDGGGAGGLYQPAGGGVAHGFGPGGAVTMGTTPPPAHLPPYPLGGLGAHHGEDFGNGHHGEHGVGGLHGGGMGEAPGLGRLAALIAAITGGSHGTIGEFDLPPGFGGAEFNFHRPQDILKGIGGIGYGGHVVDGLPPSYGGGNTYPAGGSGIDYKPPIRRREALAHATHPSFKAA